MADTREVDERVRRIDFEQRLLHQPRHRRARPRCRARCRASVSRRPWPSTIRMTAPRRCAERHANADLARAERHEVRHHAVDAEAGEHQRERREARQQHQRELAVGDRLRDARGERLRLQQREIRVHRPQRLAHDRRHRGGADVGAHQDVGEGLRPLQRRQEVVRLGRRVQAGAAHVGDHADDLRRQLSHAGDQACGRSDPRRESAAGRRSR